MAQLPWYETKWSNINTNKSYFFSLLFTNLAIEGLNNYVTEVGSEEDKPMLQALYRAYTFLCSAYLLSPSHFGKDADGKYGKAHQRLPATIAVPLCAVAAKLDVQPFLDYHYSYSLCNYVKIDKAGDLHWENLKMACRYVLLHRCLYLEEFSES